MTGRLFAAVLLLSAMLACRGTPAPALPAPPPGTTPSAASLTSLDRLRQQVANVLADPALGAGAWGVEARSLSTKDTLLSVNPRLLLMPASTAKTFTLAATAATLGWDYRFETRVIPVGAIKDGVLDGDLLIIGSGDPSVGDWDGSASATFASWAARLKELGITTIGGRIVGNDDVFADEGLGAGWMWDDMAYGYSAPASGLQFNEGTARIQVDPGSAAGDPAVLSLIPPHARVPVVNRVITGAAGSANRLALGALPRTPGATLTGTISLDSARQVREVSVGNPTLYFANAVRSALIANGIDVFGGAVDADDLVDPPLPGPEHQVIRYQSPPLSALADTLMKLSQNMYAETFLRTLGVARRQTGTAEAGLGALRDTLTDWGVPAADVQVADGSGLSRYDLVTADATVSVLAHVYEDAALRGPFLASLPVAGKAGTLANRLKGTSAEGVVQAKTGSFTNARAVAGFTTTADGEPVVFSVIANNYGVPTAPVDRATDAIILALTTFKR